MLKRFLIITITTLALISNALAGTDGELILKKNKPVIFISGHFANFELMSMKIVESNIKLATIYRH